MAKTKAPRARRKIEDLTLDQRMDLIGDMYRDRKVWANSSDDGARSALELRMTLPQIIRTTSRRRFGFLGGVFAEVETLYEKFAKGVNPAMNALHGAAAASAKALRRYSPRTSSSTSNINAT